MSGGSYDPNSIDAVLSRIENTLQKLVLDTEIYRKQLDAKIDATDAENKRISSEFSSFKTKVATVATLLGGASGHVGGWLQKFFGNN